MTAKDTAADLKATSGSHSRSGAGDSSTAVSAAPTPPSAQALKKADASSAEAAAAIQRSQRPMPNYRCGIIEEFRVGGGDQDFLEGLLITGMRDDDSGPRGGVAFGEMFVELHPTGRPDEALVAGLLNALCQSVSIAVQHGVPVEVFVERMTKMRFEPNGATSDPQIPQARSLVDYLFSRVALSYLDQDVCRRLGVRAEVVSGGGADLHFDQFSATDDGHVSNHQGAADADASSLASDAISEPAPVTTLRARRVERVPARRRRRAAPKPHLGGVA